MKLERKDGGGRKSQQHPNYPQPKPSPVQSAVESAHQESDSKATNMHAKTGHQPSPKSLFTKSQPLPSAVQTSVVR